MFSLMFEFIKEVGPNVIPPFEITVRFLRSGVFLKQSCVNDANPPAFM